MDDKTQKMDGDQMADVPVDPWAAAFAALDKEAEENPEGTPDTTGNDAVRDGDVSPAQGADGSQDPDASEGEDGAVPEGDLGGTGDVPGEAGAEDDNGDWFGVELSQEEIDEYRDKITEQIKDQTITDVAKAFIEKGARNSNGKLGASLDDPDVCKRDRDGVPRFYNPETGREFTGDNPRRQAQEWVDDYNKQLSALFNKSCNEYSAKLMKNYEPMFAILEFAPKYKALDPVRQSMFDAMVEDYEIVDDNDNIIGYSCDLDKALAAVNRQVSIIKERYGNKGAQKPAPTGPVLDTPSIQAGTPGGEKPQFKSLQEAMEWQQDQLLAKMRNGGRR